MNKSILLGRLTKVPEIRYSQSTNTKVALFTLAVNRKYVKEGEERQTDFINIISYSKLADFAEKYLSQGIQICVSGRIQTRNYNDKNGIKRYVTEIVAEEIYFADSPKKADERALYASTPVNSTNQNNSEDEFISNGDDLPF